MNENYITTGTGTTTSLYLGTNGLNMSTGMHGTIPNEFKLGGSNNTYTITNTDMITKQVKQVQVAAFQVERNEEGVITSTKHLRTLWVEEKQGTEVKFSAIKILQKELQDLDLDKLVLKELTSVTF